MPQGEGPPGLAVAAVVVSLAVGLAGVTLLWSRSEAARRVADEAARRAEASHLLALGQVEIDGYPTAAVAYALKSLELSDSEEARLFALRALQRGPTAILAPVAAGDEDGQAAFSPAFSPDGRWLAVGGLRKVQLLHRDGGPARAIGSSPALEFDAFQPDFGPRSDRLFARKWSGDARVWSIPEGREMWRADVGWLWASRVSEEGFVFLPPVKGPRATIRSRRFDESESRLVVSVPAGHVAMDSGRSIAHVVGRRSIHLRTLRGGGEAERVVATHSADLESVALDTRGRSLAARDTAGRILVWLVGDQVTGPVRALSGQGTEGLDLDPQGRWLAARRDEGGRPLPLLWDLTAPVAAEPLELRRSDTSFLSGVAFEPSGRWLAAGNVKDTALWHLGGACPWVLRGHDGPVESVVFTRDGSQLVSAARGGQVRVWSLSADGAVGSRVLAEAESGFPFLTVDPTGRYVAVTAARGRVLVVPLAGGPARALDGFSDRAVLSRVAFDDRGRLVAAAPFNSSPAEKVVRLWDLDTGATRVLGPVPGAGDGFEGGISNPSFVEPDTVVAAVFRKVFMAFDLRDGTSRFISAQPAENVALTSRKGWFALYARSTAEDRATPLVRLELDKGQARVLTAHGGGVSTVGLDPSETLVATGSLDGTVRVGPVSGAEPHVLFGHIGQVRSLAFSPDGRWLASAGDDKTIRLWRVPDAGETPFHRLPHDALLVRLREATNLRAIPDPSAAGGYRLEPGPFPGWAKAPEW